MKRILAIGNLMAVTTILVAATPAALAAQKVDIDLTIREGTQTLGRAFDLRFLDEISDHHRAGIEMAKAAVEKAYHKELKAMAKSMVADQQKDLRKIQGWRMQDYADMQSSKKRSAGMNLSKLRQLSGNEFDLAFLDSMIMHHPAAIFMGLEATQRAEGKELRDFGQETANKQFNELDKMRKMRDSWAK
jgi:uncharacterized protein (DUF305 family)